MEECRHFISNLFPLLYCLDKQPFKDMGMGIQKGPLQSLARRLHVTCPAVSLKKKKKKTTGKQHLLPALTASCFLLFSPAGHVLSGWTLTGGEANKDSQDWRVKLFQELSFLFFLAAKAMNSLLPAWPWTFHFLQFSRGLAEPPLTPSTNYCALVSLLAHYSPSITQKSQSRIITSY